MNENHKMLSPGLLRELEFRFCRARLRPVFLPHNKTRAEGIGVFLKRLLDFRTENMPGRKYDRIFAQDLVDALKEAKRRTSRASINEISQPRMSRLLRGEDVGKDPFTNETGACLVRKIVLGYSTQTRSKKESVLLGERIVSFFFPTQAPSNKDRPILNARKGLSFFENQWRFNTEPTRTCEAISEIFAMTFANAPNDFSDNFPLQPRGNSFIVRTSGNRRFLQIDNKQQLTYSGHATIEAVKHGIDCFFLFPSKTEAEKTAKEFKSQAEIRLKGVKQRGKIETICLEAKRVSVITESYLTGDFLSRLLRWVYHSCSPSPSSLLDPFENLMMSRAPMFGPCVWDPTNAEIREFRNWFEAMVPPAIRT